MSSKAQAAELAAKLRLAAKLGDPAADAAIQLVQLMVDEAKESLVMAEGEDILRLQGGVRALIRLHKGITVDPPSLKQPAQGI